MLARRFQAFSQADDAGVKNNRFRFHMLKYNLEFRWGRLGTDGYEGASNFAICQEEGDAGD